MLFSLCSFDANAEGQSRKGEGGWIPESLWWSLPIDQEYKTSIFGVKFGVKFLGYSDVPSDIT